jgi:hypothetical protein
MGRSAKEAIAMETVRTWYESQVGGEREPTFATWPVPPLRVLLCKAEIRITTRNGHFRLCIPPSVTPLRTRLAFFHTLERLKVRYGLSAHRASHLEPDVDPEENRMGKSQREVTSLQSSD